MLACRRVPPCLVFLVRPKHHHQQKNLEKKKKNIFTFLVTCLGCEWLFSPHFWYVLVCYSYLLVYYSHVTRMYSYVTRINSYVTRMLLVCTRMLFVSSRIYSYLLVSTRMLLVVFVCSFGHDLCHPAPHLG